MSAIRFALTDALTNATYRHATKDPYCTEAIGDTGTETRFPGQQAGFRSLSQWLSSPLPLM
jgi:hypothetical protein